MKGTERKKIRLNALPSAELFHFFNYEVHIVKYTAMNEQGTQSKCSEFIVSKPYID